MNNAEILVRSFDEVEPLVWSKYPSGEPLVPFRTGPVPSAMLLRPRSMESFLAAMFWTDAIAARGYSAPVLILPNVPGARQDRLNPRGDSLFTLKSVARMINDRNFPSVVVLDPHSDVTPALIDRCEVVGAAEILDQGYMDEADLPRYTGVIAPDAGASRRAHAVATLLGVPCFNAWKSRDVGTGNLTGFGVEPLPDGHFLIVDDLCDGGGTFVGLAEKVLAPTRTCDLYVTHGLFTRGTQGLLQSFTRIITTDSACSDKPGVIVLPACLTLLGGSN